MAVLVHLPSWQGPGMVAMTMKPRARPTEEMAMRSGRDQTQQNELGLKFWGGRGGSIRADLRSDPQRNALP